MYPLTKFIQKYIPNSRLVEEIGSDIVFILPIEGSKEQSMKLFENLFNELDRNLKKLNISAYGLSDTTLEEVSQRNTKKMCREVKQKSADIPGGCQQ